MTGVLCTVYGAQVYLEGFLGIFNLYSLHMTEHKAQSIVI